MSFLDVRAEYERLRERERLELRDYLLQHEGLKAAGLKVVTRGGKGSDKYRGNYDLRNWKWVQVKSGDGFDCVISLNMLDRDPKTKNIHSLFDRIGFILAPEEWVYTDIDLPFDDEKLDKIAQLVLEQYERFLKEKDV